MVLYQKTKEEIYINQNNDYVEIDVLSGLVRIEYSTLPTLICELQKMYFEHLQNQINVNTKN